MTATVGLRNERTFASLRKHRNYRLFFCGQIVSVSGTWMQETALPWLVLEMTHSPVDVGVLIFCRNAPFTVFGLTAGVLADRFDNRRFMIATQTASMLAAAALAIVTLSGHVSLWEIYTLATLGGAATIVDAPNRQALTFRLVGRDELPNAIALNSSLFNAGRVIGPALGGILIATVGVSACFAVNAASFLAVLVCLLLMRPNELFPLDRGEIPLKARGAIRAGLRFVRSSPRIMTILAITFVITLVGFNFRVLLPVLASKTFHSGPAIFGVLWACFGLGALAGALYTATKASATWKALIVGVGGFSVGMLAIAPLHSIALVGLLLAMVGFCFTVWTATSQSILQLSTPDGLRGRVLSIYIFVFAGFAPIGGVASGWLASVGGTQLAFGVSGVIGLIVTAFAGFGLRGMRARVAPSEGPVLVTPVD